MPVDEIDMKNVPFGPRGRDPKVTEEEVIRVYVETGSTAAAAEVLPIGLRRIQQIVSRARQRQLGVAPVSTTDPGAEGASPMQGAQPSVAEGEAVEA